jgi:ACS family pantothenate transporter-like MFS transporter
MQPFGSQPATSFVFWLKAHNKTGKPIVYTVAQINEYPTLGNAFTAVYSLVAVWVSDGPLRGRRWPAIIFGNLVAIVIFVLLVVTPVFGPFSHRAPLYIVSSIGGSAVPLTMAWMAELISDNAEQRAFTAAAMNTLQCKFLTFLLDHKLTVIKKIHSQPGFHWFGSNRLTNLMSRLETEPQQ